MAKSKKVVLKAYQLQFCINSPYKNVTNIQNFIKEKLSEKKFLKDRKYQLSSMDSEYDVLTNFVINFGLFCTVVNFSENPSLFLEEDKHDLEQLNLSELTSDTRTGYVKHYTFMYIYNDVIILHTSKYQKSIENYLSFLLEEEIVLSLTTNSIIKEISLDTVKNISFNPTKSNTVESQNTTLIKSLNHFGEEFIRNIFGNELCDYNDLITQHIV